jgi:hypothetical protein
METARRQHDKPGAYREVIFFVRILNPVLTRGRSTSPRHADTNTLFELNYSTTKFGFALLKPLPFYMELQQVIKKTANERKK